MAKAITLCVVLLAIIATAFGTEHQNRMDRIKVAEAEAVRSREWQLVTGPFCEAYFKWSAEMRQRVEGLEAHCAKSLEPRP